MQYPRIIPALLLKNTGLVKGVKFKHHKYIGDPLNAVRILSEKKVDELILLDITATIEKRIPNINLIRDIADECYMPFCVGGGIKNIYDVKNILMAGAEKVVICSEALNNPNFITEIASTFGSQSVVVSIDVKKNWMGKYQVYSHCGNIKTDWQPINWAKQVSELGAGEIFLNSIDRDGTFSGYDLELIKLISENVSIPVIACGGAKSVDDLFNVVKNGMAQAASAGSLFVYYKTRDAILINYPKIDNIKYRFDKGLNE